MEHNVLLNELESQLQQIYEYDGMAEIPAILLNFRELLNEFRLEIYERQGDGPRPPPPILQTHSGDGTPPLNTISNDPTPRSSQLLFISDIEGCLEKQGAIDQNVSLCDLTNYLPRGPLFNFLLNHPKNKIAFLGDYFDKGPGVANSIKGITFLHKCFQDRVHIILGNRDVNKFRLGYEVMEKQDMTLLQSHLDKYDTKWDTWLKKQVPRKDDKGNPLKDGKGNPLKDIVPAFYHQYDSAKTQFERFKIILEESMGAGPNPNGAIISDSFKIDPNAARIGAYYLTKVFDDNVVPSDFGITDAADTNKPELNTFVKDCRYLFENGDIVKGDDDYKVLMSHAGGFNKCILQDPSFYTTIMGLQNGGGDKKRKNSELENTEDKSNKKTRYTLLYFDEMERMRRALDCTNKTISISPELDIVEAVAYHNNLYKKFVNAYFNKSIDRNSLLPQHLLLQAMGLKPDGITPSNFASFIQSCGSGCGIIEDDVNSKGFIEKLGKYKAIAHGHVPHCMRHPLLIKRNDIKRNDINRSGIVFISNDTSNGNRPKKDGSLSSLPLSYIQKSNEGPLYGIGFIEPTGIIRPPDINDINTKNNDDLYTINKIEDEDATKIKQAYNTLALTGGPYPVDKIPNTATVKEYMKWNGFAPGDIIKSLNKGGSTRKKQKRGGKKNTRRIVKNKRKTKRRNKHHCSHCK